MVKIASDREFLIFCIQDKGRILKDQIIEEIDTLEDPRYCEVLEAYFIDCLSIEQIAEEMNYKERHVYTLYKEAISLLSVSSQ